MDTLILPKQIKLATAEILYLQSDSNYTYIYQRSNRRHLLVALSLCKIQDALNQKQFVRVNRSNLVNIRFVNSYETRNNHVKLTLSNGQVFTTSRRRTEAVLKSLNSNTL